VKIEGKEGKQSLLVSIRDASLSLREILAKNALVDFVKSAMIEKLRAC
jgi:hypothetical protein